ncbi:hypothetical protein HYS79_01470 [Patescibacteria group bacterium]|nr:hypothetical protein [Patescibacteria group bacterium]
MSTESKLITTLALVAVVVFAVALALRTPPSTNAPLQTAQEVQSVSEPEKASTTNFSATAPAPQGGTLAILKDVGEAVYDHFGLTQKDFSAIKEAGFDVIEGNFDICAGREDVQYFLDSARDAGLKVILNAGAGEAEWGYTCDDNFIPGQKPVWQSEKVKQWVAAWKGHPALYAWDTSNEDGGVFPFGTGGIQPDPQWETKFALSAAQLGQAYLDVKSVDLAHPVMIRMNGWYFYDYADDFFRPGNSFANNVADIVMVNAYSNVDEYFPDFVSTVMLRATRSIYAIDPKVVFIPSLGVWEEPPIWVKPTTAHLINDYTQALKTENLIGVAFFKYGAKEGDGWYLPDSARGDATLWRTIRTLIQSRR